MYRSKIIIFRYEYVSARSVGKFRVDRARPSVKTISKYYVRTQHKF